jgi:dolichol-phosphate mannosyltransferase
MPSHFTPRGDRKDNFIKDMISKKIATLVRGSRAPRTRYGLAASFCEARFEREWCPVPMISAPVTTTRSALAPKFSIVIPTYNEAASIERLVMTLAELFRSFDLDGEIIVVDDNSPDGTGRVVDQLSEAFPVRCLHRPKKLGLSSGVIDGWRFARSDSEIVGVMDGDFSHDANIIPLMIAAISEDKCDLAIGSRYVSGGGINNWPLRRRITSLVAIALAKPLTAIRDITSGFFFIRREALDGVLLDPIGFKIGLEVFAKARYRAAREIPYLFNDRTAGTSKLNQKEIINYLLQLGRIYRDRLCATHLRNSDSRAT